MQTTTTLATRPTRINFSAIIQAGINAIAARNIRAGADSVLVANPRHAFDATAPALVPARVTKRTATVAFVTDADGETYGVIL